MKFDIAYNAQAMNFMGYKCAILNFDAPGLAKVVGRQIVSNFKSKGDPIDFSIVWAYQHLRNEYRIQFITDHSRSHTNVDVGALARKLGGLPGAGKQGGSGHPDIGNLYWKDSIFDLFKMKGF